MTFNIYNGFYIVGILGVCLIISYFLVRHITKDDKKGKESKHQNH